MKRAAAWGVVSVCYLALVVLMGLGWGVNHCADWLNDRVQYFKGWL